ncbi:hypothetical protein Tco_0304157, partial [Tanacetum coccineum]
SDLLAYPAVAAVSSSGLLIFCLFGGKNWGRRFKKNGDKNTNEEIDTQATYVGLD